MSFYLVLSSQENVYKNFSSVCSFMDACPPDEVVAGIANLEKNMGNKLLFSHLRFCESLSREDLQPGTYEYMLSFSLHVKISEAVLFCAEEAISLFV